MELFWRFLIGGTVVSMFALFADVIQPLRAAALTWVIVALALWWTRWKHLPERWLSH